MYIRREIEDLIISGSKQVPIIAIIGPRQSGKSTLIKKLFKKHVYLDMQDAELFEFANKDPKGFLNSYKNEHGIIIDEAQYVPALFPQLKVEADKNPVPGYFILSGSQNFLLHNKIRESLAGRVYFYVLLPLSIHELQQSHLLLDHPEEQLFKGFYPRVYQPVIQEKEYYENYISTYVERDIRSLKNIENVQIFKKFMQLCALRIGTTINYANLALTCGISVITAKSWLSLLETSYVLFLLPAFSGNLDKRIARSPKLYFFDVGLAATLMGIDKAFIIQKRDVYGALFENMIIVDMIKNFNAYGLKPTLTFYRDSNHKEIDLIIEVAGKIIPLEIKASETMHNNFLDTLAWFQEEVNCEQGIVIYAGDHNQTRTKGNVISWNSVEAILKLF